MKCRWSFLAAALLLTVLLSFPVAADSADVIIVGAGGAGLASAIEAADQGVSVVVLEKMPMAGGNTLYATGGMNAAGTSSQETLGIEDSPAVHYKDTMQGGHDLNVPELVEIMTEQAPVAVEWLKGLGADLADVGRLGGSSVNRTHRPTGGQPVGPHLVQVMFEAAQTRGVDVRLENEVIEILLDDNGAAHGVVVENREGTYTITAKAIVVTTGGFGANPTMFVEYDPELEGFGTTNAPSATGDGITMLTALGADLIHMDQIQTHPTVHPGRSTMITEAVRGNGAIMVNRDGARFVNEMGTRDVVSGAILDQDGQSAYLFFDDAVRGSLAAVENYRRQGIVTEADTLEELANALGVDAAALTGAVDEYNAAVAAGSDDAFGRSDLPRSLDEAPFYAIEIGPAVHHTMGGVVINERTEVQSANGSIPGLFAAGEVTGGIHGGNRLGGNALADIIVFGRIAGQQAAQY